MTHLHGGWRIGLALSLGIICGVRPDAAAVKVKAHFDKAFDFTQVRTWQWSAEGAGQVIVARTKEDDREAVRRRAEPVIMEEVTAQMQRRGLTLASGAADATVTYYLVMTIGTSSQTMGQFLPPVPEWGLPLFAPSTTALQVLEQGTLVLDLSANGRVVWRGLGEAGFTMDTDMKRREALLREAIKKVLEKYPPKK